MPRKGWSLPRWRAATSSTTPIGSRAAFAGQGAVGPEPGPSSTARSSRWRRRTWARCAPGKPGYTTPRPATSRASTRRTPPDPYTFKEYRSRFRRKGTEADLDRTAKFNIASVSDNSPKARRVKADWWRKGPNSGDIRNIDTRRKKRAPKRRSDNLFLSQVAKTRRF